MDDAGQKGTDRAVNGLAAFDAFEQAVQRFLAARKGRLRRNAFSKLLANLCREVCVDARELHANPELMNDLRDRTPSCIRHKSHLPVDGSRDEFRVALGDELLTRIAIDLTE